MNRIGALPPVFLRARIEAIDSELARMPIVTIGRHRDVKVVRAKENDNGVYRIHEYLSESVRGRQLMPLCERRRDLLINRRILRGIVGGLPATSSVRFREVSTKFDRRFWESLKTEPYNPGNRPLYRHGDKLMKSRGEVMIAQVLDSFGLEYLYEPIMIINNNTYRPDFAVWLPEFGRVFLIEFMGMLDNKEYALKNGLKLGEYMNHGIIINRDILIFGGTESGMVTVGEIESDIRALISKYCDIYAA